MFARILVEVDLAKPLTRRILVTMKEKTSCIDIEFFVDVNSESLPKYCDHCNVIDNDAMGCRILPRPFNNRDHQSQYRNDMRNVVVMKHKEEGW